MKEKTNKGNEKKFPSDQYTRNEWALLCSRHNYGMIPTNIFNKNGELVGSYPSRRQARKHMASSDKLVNA